MQCFFLGENLTQKVFILICFVLESFSLRGGFHFTRAEWPTSSGSAWMRCSVYHYSTGSSGNWDTTAQESSPPRDPVFLCGLTLTMKVKWWRSLRKKVVGGYLKWAFCFTDTVFTQISKLQDVSRELSSSNLCLALHSKQEAGSKMAACWGQWSVCFKVTLVTFECLNCGHHQSRGGKYYRWNCALGGYFPSTEWLENMTFDHLEAVKHPR